MTALHHGTVETERPGQVRYCAFTQLVKTAAAMVAGAFEGSLIIPICTVRWESMDALARSLRPQFPSRQSFASHLGRPAFLLP